MQEQAPARTGRRSSTVIAATITFALTGCTKAAPPPRVPPPPDVSVVIVTARTITESYELEGQVQPSRRVDVRSRVEGVITERPFTEGSSVAPGQLLFRLDRVKYQAAYESAKSRDDNARRTLARLEPLLAQHAVAVQDVDNAR